jgi:hypothetical protein
MSTYEKKLITIYKKMNITYKLVKKILLKILPMKVILLLLTIKHVFENYSIISRFANFERKIKKNTELSDEEYYQFEEFLYKVPNENKTYVDIGAGNGVNMSCTLPLAKNDDWNGTLFEIGEIFNLAYNYKNFSNIKIAKTKVTPNNIANLLEGFNITKEFGFLNLDIDSYDFEVMSNILKAGFNPYVISMEINEKFPPPINFYVKYNSKLSYPIGHFYGCSLAAAESLLSDNGYFLSHIYGNNAFFLNNKFYNLEKNKSITEIYKEGYINFPNRKEVYHYNKDVDELLNLSFDEAIKFIDIKFQDLQGEYVLK